MQAIDPGSEIEQRRARRRAERRRRQVRRRRAVALSLSGALAATLVLLLRGGGETPAPQPSAQPAPQPAPLRPAELAGQRLIAGWDGVEPPRGLRRLIRQGGVAGVILFSDNLADRPTARATIRSLQRTPRPEGLSAPLLVMVDQEGGQVRRLAGPPIASAEEMGRRGADFARGQGRATAADLERVGINVDLAPVLDLARPGGAIDREQRSFGRDPETVIEIGVGGFAAGLEQGGVLATAKHFPGIGFVETNTDEAAQEVDLTAAELAAGPERPFRSFIEAGGPIVMLSLATYPEIAERPAAFSARLATEALRGRLGFEGVSITDGLGAAAAAEFGSPRRVALAAEAAGNDLLLYSDWRAAREAGRLLGGRLRSGRLPRERFEESARRVLSLRGSIEQRSSPGPGSG